MKRSLVVLVGLLALVLAAPAVAQNPTVSTGRLTADAVVASNACYLYKVKVETEGVTDCKITVYDNTAGSGTIVSEFTVAAADDHDGEIFQKLTMSNGIYADITTSGTCYYWIELER
jgi:hypothetical protein